MLRLVIWLLVLANGAYFAWTQGYLAAVGFAPVEQREPQRLKGELRPETLRLLNSANPPRTPEATTVVQGPTAPTVAPSAPATAPASAPETPPVAATPSPAAAPPQPTPTPAPEPASALAAAEKKACWQATGFTEAQADTLRAALALQDVPVRWQLTEYRSGGRWIVYMGRYDNNEQLERKKAELRELKVDFREVTGAGLSPGLALGTYSTEAAAQQALQAVGRSGVRTAQVAQDRAEAVGFTLKLPSVTTRQRDAVAALAGKTLQSCN